MPVSKEVYSYKKIDKRILLFILLSLVFLTLDGIRLFSTSAAVGIDGYYYVLQVESLVQYGGFRFPAPLTLILYFLAGLTVFLGNAVLAIKIGALLLHLFLSLGIFSIIKILTENTWLCILAVCLAWVSGLHLYLIVEYINFLGAIAFITWGAFFVILAFKRQKWIWSIGGLVCFLIAAGCHRSAIPLILTLIIATALMWWWRFAIRVRSAPQIILSSLVATLIFLAPAILVIQPFFILPFGLYKEFWIIPRNPIKLANFPELVSLLALAPLTLILIARWKNKIPDAVSQVVFGTSALWSILIMLNPFISSQLGFLSLGGRLRTLAYIQVAIIVPGVIWMLGNVRQSMAWLVPVFITPLMIWSFFFNPLPRGAQAEYLTQRENLINALKTHGQQLEKDSLIIAEHGEQFAVTSITGIASQQEFPKANKSREVYWLLNKIPPTLIDSSMITIMTDKNEFHTILVKDDELWRQRLKNGQIRYQFLKNNRHLDVYFSENLLVTDRDE